MMMVLKIVQGLWIGGSLLLLSCSEVPKKAEVPEDLLSERPKISMAIFNPDGHFKWGDSVKISISALDTFPVSDVKLYWKDSLLATSATLPFRFTCHTKFFTVGMNLFTVKAKEGNQTEIQTRSTLEIFSNQEPESYTYSVLASFPHKTDAYTQGLEFDQNTLVEGTGLEGKSTLKRVNLLSGEAEKSIALEPNVFGEGITVFNNLIYQISWQNRQGFMYDKNSLELKGKFSYSGEGWGLTHYKNQLIKSDGSHLLTFHNPKTFAEEKQLEVYDNKGKVKFLNELEVVENTLFANLYTSDSIAKIDLKTGKVLAYINLSGLLTAAEETEEVDVLNGIAWHPTQKELFVTGKNWPKLFKIKLLKRAKV